MGANRVHIARIGRAASLLAVLGGAAACASGRDGPDGPAALFRTQVGQPSEAVAPGLRSGWYVQHEPVQYARTGLAGWRPARSGLAVWAAQLLGRPRGEADMPVAVAALNSDLPAPSLVQVTNLLTFRTITVRVDDKARLPGQIIRLPEEVARALGADPAQPLPVRLRYFAPVHAYREPPTLREALLGRTPHPPTSPAPAQLANQAKPSPPTAPARPAALRAEAPPPILIRTALASPLPAPAASLPAPAPAPGRTSGPPLRPALPQEPEQRLRIATAAASAGFRIQAGAFALRANAERAATRLSTTGGRADIVPLKRGDQILYRVVLAAPGDAAAAERLRARVAQIGFADALLIRPL